MNNDLNKLLLSLDESDASKVVTYIKHLKSKVVNNKRFKKAALRDIKIALQSSEFSY